jgi:hypothetical protein
MANEYEKGLLMFRNGLWVPFIEKGNLPIKTKVVDFLSINNDTSLIVTKKDGLLFKS